LFSEVHVYKYSKITWFSGWTVRVCYSRSGSWQIQSVHSYSQYLFFLQRSPFSERSSPSLWKVSCCTLQFLLQLHHVIKYLLCMLEN